jgi:phytoene synthase
MLSFFNSNQKDEVWSINGWEMLERDTRARAMKASGESEAWKIINVQTRAIMRNYSTSFFMVSRFLPPVKREKVEAVYAAVRYPDEIVDTFPISSSERMEKINIWANHYEEGLKASSLNESLERGVPSFLAGFVKVVRETGIPAEHYRAFLEAMKRDIAPCGFETLEDLIDNYIYGSAIVVGYFLTYIYDSKSKENFNRALGGARNLGIALQLTNFLRDVREDDRRGRVYLPTNMLREEGIEKLDLTDTNQYTAIHNVLRKLGMIAENYYAKAQADLDAFSTDCQIAVRACMKVYRRLNERIVNNNQSLMQRESVPLIEKFRLLPASKYWRVPLAYLKK